MAKKQAPPDREFLGYLPPPPGDDDPFEEAPRVRTPMIVPSDSVDDDTPFEDELSSPYGLDAEPKPPSTVPPAGPDPRELARKLVEEARAKARAAEPRRSREKAAPEPEPEPEPIPAPAPAPLTVPRKNRLSERAGGRLISAEEALKRAAEREADEAKTKKKADRVAARAAATAVLAESDEDADVEPKRKRRTADSLPPRDPTPRAAPPREARPPMAPDQEPTPPIDVEAAIARVAPGATVLEVVPLTNTLVFRALWTAHRARAWATRDLALLATAAVLLDAVDRVPAGHLVAVRANVGGRLVAAWVDTSRGVVLGLTEPPEVYLAGL